jgi:hypothetical protein
MASSLGVKVGIQVAQSPGPRRPQATTVLPTVKSNAYSGPALSGTGKLVGIVLPKVSVTAPKIKVPTVTLPKKSTVTLPAAAPKVAAPVLSGRITVNGKQVNLGR